MNGLSLFANVGIAETYFAKHGIDVKVASELLKERVDIYRHLYPDVNMFHGDITDADNYCNIIKAAKKAKCDFILATPPCQGMSTAGKMLKDDPRNRLVINVVDAIKDINPKFVIIENVPEILKTKIKVQDDWILITDYLQKEIGDNYSFNERKVVNAMNYGVPQSRERCIILLARKDQNIKWEFPEPSEELVTMRMAIGDLPSLDPEVTDISEEERLRVFPHFYP